MFLHDLQQEQGPSWGLIFRHFSRLFAKLFFNFLTREVPTNNNPTRQRGWRLQPPRRCAQPIPSLARRVSMLISARLPQVMMRHCQKADLLVPLEDDCAVAFPPQPLGLARQPHPINAAIQGTDPSCRPARHSRHFPRAFVGAGQPAHRSLYIGVQSLEKRSNLPISSHVFPGISCLPSRKRDPHAIWAQSDRITPVPFR